MAATLPVDRSIKKESFENTQLEDCALWYLIGAIVIVALLIQLWPLALAALIAIVAYYIVRHIRMRRYFTGEEFLARKAEISTVVSEHNDIVQYVSEIHDRGSFQIGVSLTGARSHLATSENTSRHNYRRDRNVANFQASNVHNCSLQVVRNASSKPLKYLIKYFNIESDEAGLADVEGFGEELSRLESAVQNLKQREVSISEAFDPPAFILKHYKDAFMAQIGVELASIRIPYPNYVFEYVSAGGNSSQRTTVKLDTPATDVLIELLSEKIRFRKSAAGQRALMTTKLRNTIKDRDDYTCQFCEVSLEAEPHLLLEIDHIVPVSKGGLSADGNLQTLCWRCNRTKSDKMLDT